MQCLRPLHHSGAQADWWLEGRKREERENKILRRSERGDERKQSEKYCIASIDQVSHADWLSLAVGGEARERGGGSGRGREESKV